MWQNLMCVTYLMIFKRMEDFFLANGAEIVDSADDADWVLIGACGAFYGQIDHFFDELERFARGGARVVVYGCLPRISPERYRGARDSVAFYVDTRHPEEVARMLPEVIVPWSRIPDSDGFRMVDYRHFDPAKKYVTVQEGCNSKCVFCPHINGIGPQRSTPAKQVVELIRRHLEGGAETILLEGRDIGSWGTDLEPARTFPDLLEEILALPGDFALLINQLGANWAIRYQDRLLDLLIDPRVCDVHIPIQTVSDRLLGLMGREPGVRRLEGFLGRLRGRSSRTVLRTDIMIGFPTETEEEFAETLQFVADYFDEVAYYGFELHPNTPVAGMGLPFCTPDLIQRRVDRAAAFIEKTPRLVWHRGGQVPHTMLAREEHKLRLKRK
jgi:tRNA A37 methylthiotransferase MiaB